MTTMVHIGRKWKITQMNRIRTALNGCRDLQYRYRMYQKSYLYQYFDNTAEIKYFVYSRIDTHVETYKFIE